MLTSRRWDLCDELKGLVARIAAEAPDQYPDFLREIGANMDNDFARIEAILVELPAVLNKDHANLECTSALLAEARRLYYAGQVAAGAKILWHIYNDEPVMQRR